MTAVVDVWLASTRRSETPWPLVPDHEVPRLERLRRAEDRDASALALAVVRLAAAEAVGCHVDVVRVHRRCPRCGRDSHGPLRLTAPGLVAPHVSVSHSGHVVMVALCLDAPVGVDVEAVPDVDPDDELLACVLPVARRADGLRAPRAERRGALAEHWTRKEAVLKALGVGIVVPLAELDPVDGVLWRPGARTSPLLPVVAEAGVGVTITEAPPGFRAAVAVVGDHPRAVHHDAGPLLRRGLRRSVPPAGAPPGGRSRPRPGRTGW